MKRFALVLWLFAASCFAQGITITAPTKPISPGRFVLVPFVGLTEEEEGLAKVEVTPAESVIARPFGRGMLLVLVQDEATAGKRTLTIGLNTWRRSVMEALAAARAAKVDDVIADLEAANKKAEPYPLKSGQCLLEVAGQIPFPPVDPDDPNPPHPPQPPSPNKVSRVTYVWEKDLTRLPPFVASALNKINVESSGSVFASEFEDDTTDGTNQTPDQYKIALEAAQKVGLPALVVQAGNSVIRVVKDLKTEQQVLDAARK